MKTKTSITISKDILKLVDEQVKDEKSRSAFIETAIRTYLEVLKRQKRDQNDLSIINQNMENLNREAIDVLRYQTEL